MRRIGGIAAARRRRIPIWCEVVLTVLALAAVAWFLVRPQLTDVEQSVAALAGVSVPLVILAAAFEVLSLASFTGLTAVVLGWSALRYGTLLRIDLADLAINHTTPGGGAIAGAARFRLLVAEGIEPRRAISTATVEVSLSNLAIVAVFVAGIALSIARVRAAPSTFAASALVVIALVVGIGTAAWVLLRRTDRLVRAARWLGRRIPLIGADRAGGTVRALADDLRRLAHDRRRLAWACGLALGNWCFDAASLWVLLAALDVPLGVGPLLTVYGLGSLMAFLPLTPGGLGLVEGVMVPALHAFGVPHASALLGVVGWRVLEYWLPIPIGAIACASLHLGRARRRRAAASDGRAAGSIAEAGTAGRSDVR